MINQPNKNEDKPLESSVYRISDWIGILIALIGSAVMGLVSVDIPGWLFWIAITISVVISLWIASYFCLYKAVFYADRVEVNYFIKHSSEKKSVIRVADIVMFKYKYTGGRGSGGNGFLKVYYYRNGKKNSIRFLMGVPEAKKVCLIMKENGKEVIFDDRGLLGGLRTKNTL